MLKTVLYIIRFCLIFIILLFARQVNSQKTFTDATGQIKHSNFDSWFEILVKESGIIGGEEKHLHQIGKKGETSPWKTTNLTAKVGVDVGQVCVFPEKRGEGFCCRMETTVRKIGVIGIKFNTLLTGNIFLGTLDEPFRSVNDPIRRFNAGIPFSGKPKAVKFDFKHNQGKNRVNAVYSVKPVSGSDKAEFCILLQKRWEDENGNIKAIRVGGARNYLRDTKGSWVNDTTITIHYGDITGKPVYNPKTMDLIPKVSEMYALNSKGKMVPVTETGWDNDKQTPTHVVAFFTSSYDGINYNGSTESVLWVDNFKLIY